MRTYKGIMTLQIIKMYEGSADPTAAAEAATRQRKHLAVQLGKLQALTNKVEFDKVYYIYESSWKQHLRA